jgi:hypothetical protein
MAKGDLHPEYRGVKLFGLLQIAGFERDMVQSFSRHETDPPFRVLIFFYNAAGATRNRP